MSNKNNQINRYKKMKWVVDENKIVLGPKREYTPKTLRTIAIAIMALCFVFICLFGSQVIKFEMLSSTFIMVVLFVVFLYGIQLNGIVREALVVIDEREKEIINARNYYERGKKGK